LNFAAEHFDIVVVAPSQAPIARKPLNHISNRISRPPSENIAAIRHAFFVFLPESHVAFYRGIIIWQKRLKSLSEIAELLIGVLSNGILRGGGRHESASTMVRFSVPRASPGSRQS
jgi:hypothetical protein